MIQQDEYRDEGQLVRSTATAAVDHIIRAEDVGQLKDGVRLVAQYLVQCGSVIEHINVTILEILLRVAAKNSGIPDHVRDAAMGMIAEEMPEIVLDRQRRHLDYIGLELEGDDTLRRAPTQVEEPIWLIEE